MRAQRPLRAVASLETDGGVHRASVRRTLGRFAGLLLSAIGAAQTVPVKDPFERVGTAVSAPPVHHRLTFTPVPPPAPEHADEGEDDEGKSRLPRIPDGTTSGPLLTTPPTAATASGAAPAAAPIAIWVNSEHGAGAPVAARSVIGEPTTAQNRDTAFYTANWFAARSIDSGMTWSFVNPAAAPIDGGFCCDQWCVYVPSRDITVWLIQYAYDSSPGGTQHGSYRLVVFRGRDNLKNGVSHSVAFSPERVGFPAQHWFDFPHVGFTNNVLWVTFNVYTAPPANAYAGSMIQGLDLDALAAGQPVPYRFAAVNNVGPASWRVCTGGSTTAYWGAHLSTTALRVMRWDEASANPAADDVNGITAWFRADNATPMTPSPGPDARDWVGRSDNRIMAAWVRPGTIGFMWNSNSGGGYALPNVRVARFNEANRTLQGQAAVWSNNYAWLYPATCTNAAGDVGGVIAAGGGAVFPHSECFIMDALTQGPVFDSINPQDGNSGPAANNWGDYYGIWTHPVAPRTWIAATMALRGGGANGNQTPRFVWFGRPQYTPQWVSLTVNSTPAQGVRIVMAQTDLDGNKDGNTSFGRRLAPQQGYTLLAPLQHVTPQGVLVFDRWAINGAPQPIDQLLLDVSSIGVTHTTVEARYVPVRALAISSTNPAVGVPITVDTTDITGSRDGLTGFTRFYKNLTVVGLTAPATMGINPFRRWRLNGTPQPDNQRTANVGLVLDVFALAEYWDHVLGSFTPFGSGCSYSNGQDVLTASGTPETGQTPTYRLAGGRAQSGVLLMIGFDNTRWTTIPLPLPLAPFAPGCTLYNGLDGILTAGTNAAGTCSISVPIPPDVNLIGGHFYCQYWCLDPGANAINLSFSNGMDTLAGGLR